MTQPPLLDRDHWQRFATLLPANDRRTKAAKAYRNAHKEYTAHQARWPALTTEIKSVVREISRNPDPQLSARLSMLTAQRDLWPEILCDLAERYAKAFQAWATPTYRALQQLGNAAADDFNASQQEYGRLTRRMSTAHHDAPQYEEAQAALRKLTTDRAPDQQLHRDAERAMNAIVTAAGRLFGTPVPRCQIHPNHIRGFVDRHRTYVPQEAA